MTITFIGHGYVGLVTAAVFADLGNTVWVIGHTQSKIDNLQKGILPIYEPGLEEVVKRNVAEKRLLFTLSYDEAIAQSDVVFIAVGTPSLPSGEADLSVVYQVAEEIGKHVTKDIVVVTKSTVPVGTNREVKKRVEQHAPKEGVTISIASVPEFLREGQALGDTFHPDRVIIGVDSKEAQQKLTDLHASIDAACVITTIETAEMIKYASNAFLATKISYANAIAQLSEKVGADAVQVLAAIGLDKRIGTHFLNPGAGYGGSCFPKDVKALIAIAKDAGYQFSLLEEVEHINKQAMESICQKVAALFPEGLAGKTIGVLGLSFKPDTDDMRAAPSLVVIKKLQEQHAMIKVYDPIAMENAKTLLSDVTFCSDMYEVAKESDCLVIMTEWNQFKEMDKQKVKELMKTPKVVDSRNIYTPEEMKTLGFTYKGVGR